MLGGRSAATTGRTAAINEPFGATVRNRAALSERQVQAAYGISPYGTDDLRMLGCAAGSIV